MKTAERTFAPDTLRDWTARVLCALGAPEDDAQTVAHVLVLGNLRGVDSHGVRLLLKNSEGLRDGALNATPSMRVKSETPATVVFDGDGGMGQLICTRAMDVAIGKAKKSGAGVVVTRNASHCGMSAAYVLQAIEKDLVGVVLSNNKASMAVAGGYDWTIGNNTIACGIPAVGAAPIVLDMTTAAITWGMVITLATAGLPLPENAIVFRNPEGGALTDASRAYSEGTVLPIGGHKGSGLAIAIECLTGVLSGGPFAEDVGTVFLDTSKREHHSQFILVVSPDVFMPAETYKRRVADFIAYVKGSPRLAHVKEILLPGERADRCQTEREENGIPIPASVLQNLDSLAEQLGVASLSEL